MELKGILPRILIAVPEAVHARQWIICQGILRLFDI